MRQKNINIYRNRYAPCAGKNKAHTQTNKHDREHKLTSFLLFVTRHIVSIETNQSSLQNSKAVKDHVCLCTMVFVSCKLNKVEKKPVVDIVCLLPDFQRQPETQQSLASMNKDTEWDKACERGRERERERHIHTMLWLFYDLHKHVLNFGTLLQVIWEEDRRTKG